MCVSFRANLKGLSEQSRGLCEWPVKLHPPSTAASLGALSRLIRMEGTIINYKILSTNEPFDLSRQSGSDFQGKVIRKRY